jgi:hypothetical protein
MRLASAIAVSGLKIQPQSKRKSPALNLCAGLLKISSGLFSSFLRGASHLLNRHVLIFKRAVKTEKPCAELAQGF